MKQTRRNPSQLIDPRVSVVIPVTTKKTLIWRILAAWKKQICARNRGGWTVCSKDERGILQTRRSGKAGIESGAGR